MPTTKENFGNVVRVIHEPGNGTRYEAIGVQLPYDEECWLVSFPELGPSYYFRRGSHVMPYYVAEKMGVDRRGLRISDADINEMAVVISKITAISHLKLAE